MNSKQSSFRSNMNYATKSRRRVELFRNIQRKSKEKSIEMENNQGVSYEEKFGKGNCRLGKEGNESQLINIQCLTGDITKITIDGYVKLINNLFAYLKKILNHLIYENITKFFNGEIHKSLNESSLHLQYNHNKINKDDKGKRIFSSGSQLNINKEQYTLTSNKRQAFHNSISNSYTNSMIIPSTTQEKMSKTTKDMDKDRSNSLRSIQNNYSYKYYIDNCKEMTSNRRTRRNSNENSSRKQVYKKPDSEDSQRRFGYLYKKIKHTNKNEGKGDIVEQCESKTERSSQSTKKSTDGPIKSLSKNAYRNYCIKANNINSNSKDNNNNACKFLLNDEMITYIKLTLDDDMKQMFNFSYEHFLSKESEKSKQDSI